MLMKIKFFNMKSVWLFLFAMISLSVAAQERSISGTVSDASTKEPLIGVTVLVEGTFTGTVTDFDGNYTIKVESGKNLVFHLSDIRPKPLQWASNRKSMYLLLSKPGVWMK